MFALRCVCACIRACVCVYVSQKTAYLNSILVCFVVVDDDIVVVVLVCFLFWLGERLHTFFGT